jgi:DNA-binding GntR family transcriptional regulator
MSIRKQSVRRRAAGESTDLAEQLAIKIVEYIRRDDMPVGAHVTEQSIVNACHVSRSPVRKAMALLADRGVLASEKNRGYYVRRNGPSLDKFTAAGSDPDGDDIYLRLTDDRLRGRLGLHVSEVEIRRRYGLSQAEARKILHRLMREDLIIRKPGRGWMFQPILATKEAHDQSYRFRMIIEPAAILEPTYKVNPEAFARIRRQQEAMLHGDIVRLSRARIFQVGSEFHETIVGCSGNRFLLDTIRRQNQLRRLIEYRGNFDRSRLTRQCREHLRLLDLLESGKMNAAAEFLRRHLDVVRDIKTGIKSNSGAAGGRPAGHF